MAHAHMPKGVKHVFMREHATRKGDFMADFIKTVGHAGFLMLMAPNPCGDDGGPRKDYKAVASVRTTVPGLERHDFEGQT